MLDVVNSLVTKATGLTPAQMQAASANGAVNIDGTWYQPQYDSTGSGENYQQGPLTGYLSYSDAANKVGGAYNQYDAQGNFVREGTQQKVDATKDFLKFAALAAGGMYGLGGFDGLAAGAGGTGASSAFELANAGAGAFEGGTALNTLATMTPAELAKFEALNAGSTAMTDLGASELANAGASANTIGGTTAANAANAATTTAAANAAKTGLLGLTTADALALQTGGTLLSGLVNKNAVSNASDIINQAGASGTKTLSDVYTGQKDINTANNLALANNYLNLNTNLNNTLTGQVGAYNTANTNINANAANEMALLKSNLANQTAQANANANALNANYGATRGDLYNIYNQQVGIQQPYQAVGRTGANDLIANNDYFQHQFNANDLNTNLAPNYAFQLAQGQMANQRAGNASGGALGGNALQGLQKYTQDYAGNAYQQAFNNYNTQRQNIYSTLSGMANIGTTSGGQLASLGNTLGGNLGSLSSNLGGNLTSNTGNLLGAGNAYGTNTAGVTNNLNNVLSSNLGQLQGAYNQYGSNLTNASNNYGGNLTTGAGQIINAGNVYGTNQTGLTTGLAAANAQNQVAGANVVGTTLNNLGNTALLSSLIKAT